MKIGLSGDTSVAAASVRNRSLQDLTRWERRKPEAYLDPQIPFHSKPASPPLQQLEVVLEELPGDVSPRTVFGDASDQMDRVLTTHARPNAELQGLRQQGLVGESSKTRPVDQDYK